MTDWDDHQLLTAYARSASEPAFATLVARYVNLVYSAALRFTGNPHHAQEITQAVFIILARKAGNLRQGVVLSGWLYQTARLTAANFVKGETRRQKREQEAYMQSTLNEPATAAWQQIAPVLEEAMGCLGETDRNVVVLRYFENKTATEVAVALKLSDSAAHKRVTRALEKLRKFFAKRGVTLSATAIAGAVLTNSVQAAPAGLAKTISVVALAKGAAAGGSTLTLVKGALKVMAWTKIKTAVVVGVVALLAASTTTLVVEKIAHPTFSATNLAWANDPRYWELNSQVLDKLPPVYILRPTQFPHGGGSVGMGNPGNRFMKILHINADVSELVMAAYDYNRSRCVFPENLPAERYDLMFTLPEDYHPKLKAEINSRFGLTAHEEQRMQAVWVLQVKVPDASGLKPHSGNGSSWMGSQYGAKIRGFRIGNSLRWLENMIGQPVIDRTGLTGSYDVDLNWQPAAGQSEADALRQALLDQLGLELAPDQQSINMLIVEKVN